MTIAEGIRTHRFQRPRQVFTLEEDIRLAALVQDEADPDWGIVASAMPGRTARQCRMRWMNNLRPGRITTPLTAAEDEYLLQQVALRGQRWKQLSSLPTFEGRTPEWLKNRWRALGRQSRGFHPADPIFLRDEPDDDFAYFRDLNHW
jgi:hypothetical protein